MLLTEYFCNISSPHLPKELARVKDCVYLDFENTYCSMINHNLIFNFSDIFNHQIWGIMKEWKIVLWGCQKIER